MQTIARATGMILIGIIFLGIALPVFGQETISRVTDKRVNFHSVDVFIQTDGSASVEERFFFTFFAGEAAQFEKDFGENTPSLAEWKNDYPFVQPYLGLSEGPTNIGFLLNRTAEGDPSLTMTYNYPSGLVQPVRSEAQGRITRWKVSDIAFVDFITGGNITIPRNTQVRFHFPESATIDESLLPQGVTVNGNVLTLNNFQSNELTIQYTQVTPIADPIDVGEIMKSFTQSAFFPLVVGLAILGIGYGFVNREKLGVRIEEYLIEHSEFRPSPKQDIDAELEATREG